MNGDTTVQPASPHSATLMPQDAQGDLGQAERGQTTPEPISNAEQIRAAVAAMTAAKEDAAVRAKALITAQKDLARVNTTLTMETTRLRKELAAAEARIDEDRNLKRVHIVLVEDTVRLRSELATAVADRATAVEALGRAEAVVAEMAHLRAELAAAEVRSEAERALKRAHVILVEETVHLRSELAMTVAERAAAIEALGQAETAETLRLRTDFAAAQAAANELRRALDTAEAETRSAREMIRELAARYAAALDRWRAARDRDPVVRLPPVLARLRKRKRPNPYADDLFVLENSIYFDREWYLENNPDVAAEAADPALHYLLHGAAEDRDPGPWFSTRQYLLDNPDVAAEGANALLHYVRHGEGEGRIARRGA